MKHSGDLLLCQQNGFIDYKGRPCVGLGDEGLNCMQQVNFISFNGIGNITDDNDSDGVALFIKRYFGF